MVLDAENLVPFPGKSKSADSLIEDKNVEMSVRLVHVAANALVAIGALRAIRIVLLIFPAHSNGRRVLKNDKFLVGMQSDVFVTCHELHRLEHTLRLRDGDYIQAALALTVQGTLFVVVRFRDERRVALVVFCRELVRGIVGFHTVRRFDCALDEVVDRSVVVRLCLSLEILV